MKSDLSPQLIVYELYRIMKMLKLRMFLSDTYCMLFLKELRLKDASDAFGFIFKDI